MEKNTIIHKIVPSEARISRNVLTREEMTAAIGYRASQIANEGGEVYIDTTKKYMNNPLNIAAQELAESKFPLKLHRYVGSEGNTWYWEEFDINTMTKIDLDINPEVNI